MPWMRGAGRAQLAPLPCRAPGRGHGRCRNGQAPARSSAALPRSAPSSRRRRGPHPPARRRSFSIADLTSRWTRWPAPTCPAARRRARRPGTGKPACLPSNCCAAPTAPRRRGRAPRPTADGSADARRSAAPPCRGRRARMLCAATTWQGSPLWEAQASAISASVRRKRSAAPDSTNASACRALTAERGKTARSTSPSASTPRPSASTTATAPQ